MKTSKTSKQNPQSQKSQPQPQPHFNHRGPEERAKRQARRKAKRAQATAERNVAEGFPPDHKRTYGKPFVKGDPRINRSGANIVSFHQLRAKVQDHMNEEFVREDHPERGPMTKLDHLLLDIEESRNDENVLKVLEIGYGKVPNTNINMDFDFNQLLENIDIKKLTNEQIDQLSAGHHLIEVLLAPYLKTNTTHVIDA